MNDCREEKCRDVALHEMHICQLTKRGHQSEVKARTSDPAFICHNCNSEANLAGDLCNPSALVRR